MSEEDVKQFLDFTCAYGRCVCQLSNRQSYTKAKAGTLPHSCCSNNFFWESVQLDIGNGHIEEKESEEECVMKRQSTVTTIVEVVTIRSLFMGTIE